MEDEMCRLTATVMGATAMLSLAAPAAAQSDYWPDHHAQEHRQLRSVHHDFHDELDEEHAYAHEMGLTRRDHRRLHRELRYEHRRADRELRHEHRDHDRNDRWDSYDGY